MAKSSINNKLFERQIKKYLKKAKSTGTKEIRKLALFALGQVMRKSPVDEGTFRGNWNVGLNKIDSSFNLSHSGTAGKYTIDASKFAEGTTVIGSIKAGDSVNISNALPYAMRLEYGWSDQAPAGIVRVTQFELLQWIKSRNEKV